MTETDRRDEILRLCAFIKSKFDKDNSLVERASAINRLEILSGMSFKNTEELHNGLSILKTRMELAKRIEAVRTAKGLTTKQLAKSLKISMGEHALVEMEKGTRQPDEKILKFLMTENGV